jgi:PAS domain S-box-containing protein
MRNEDFLLLNEIPLPLFVAEKAGFRLRFVNQYGIMAYGLDSENPPALCFTDFHPPDEREKIRVCLLEKQNQPNLPGIWRHILRNGNITEVEILFRDTFYGNPDHIILIINNLSRNVSQGQDSGQQLYLRNDTAKITPGGYFTKPGNQRYNKDLVIRKSSVIEILLSAATNFINIPANGIDAAIRKTLEEAGRFTRTDRAFIFEYDFAHNVCRNTYEWCASGEIPEKKNLRSISLDLVPEWLERHRQNKTAIIQDSATLPQESGVRRMLESQGVRSHITIPIFLKNELFGFIGFENIKSVKRYTETESRILDFLAGIIANALNCRDNEWQLIETEEKFRQLADHVTEIFWLMDLDSGRVEYKNPAYRIFFGETGCPCNENLSGMISRTYPEDTEILLKCLNQTDTGATEMVSIRFFDNRDELRWYQLKVYPVSSHEGIPARQVGIAHDITSLKHAEINLQNALELEKRVGEMKSALVSSASHEFRTPLTNIHMSAEAILRYRQNMTDQDVERHTETIINIVQNMHDLINKVLNDASVESGRIAATMRICDVSELISEWYEKNCNDLNTSHTVRCSVPPAPVVACIDQQLILNAVENLVFNSIKYSPERTEILIRLTTRQDWLSLVIADHGFGITREDQANLFEAGFRSTRLRNIPGNGLGLHFVRKIIEIHGGMIQVKSKVNKGSVFMISIPLSN